MLSHDDPQQLRTKVSKSLRNGSEEHWVGKTGEGAQKVQTSSYKVSHGDVAYSMVTIVKNTLLHI